MQLAENNTRVLAHPTPTIARPEITVGERVRLVSGELTGLEGVVVRCGEQDDYIIGIPDANSGVLIRVHRQRFRQLRFRRSG